MTLINPTIPMMYPKVFKKFSVEGGMVQSDYSVSSLSEKESRERESLTILNHTRTDFIIC